MKEPVSEYPVPTKHLDEAREAASVVSAEYQLETAIAPYRDMAWRGNAGTRPTLHLDDVSGIPFLVDIPGVEEYQHRARVRAGDQDLFAASTPATPGYERYCRDILGMGSPTMLLAEPAKNRLAVAEGCAQGPVFDTIVQTAKDGHGLVIHPYMGIEEVWTLARSVAEASSQPETVIAPPPAVTWIANDKHAFGQLVELVLGPGWLVETHTTHDPHAMASALRLLALRHDRVGLKRTRCASAMGNMVYERQAITAKSDDELFKEVQKFLVRTEWPQGEAVLAVAWESTDLSPSTQMWIPALGMGSPRVEGIYEQILVGEHKVFVGSRPSQLPRPVNMALAESASLVAAGLQALGYVGRCSFDHLVVGDPNGDYRTVFVECNGRWGGTSSPMSLLDRLIPGARPPYRAQDFEDERLVGVPFDVILERVGPELYRPTEQRGRFIFYNVGPLAGSGKLDVIAFADNQADAERALVEDLPALLFS